MSWLAADLAGRFLRGGRSELLRSTARAALASVAIGVAALVIAMALVSGYRGAIEDKLVEGNAAVMVYALDPARAPLDSVTAAVAAIDGVARVRRVVYGQGTVTTTAGVSQSVTLRGLEDLPASPDGPAVARLGSELAKRLGVEDDAVLRLAALGFERGRPRFAYRSLTVGGTFHYGFAEFDQGWVELDLATVASLVGDGAGQLIEVGVDDASQASTLAVAIREAVGQEYLVTDWRELNAPLFAALDLQKLALFFLLGLIVLVSTFNVAATLVVLVRERRREIGVLAALGLEGRQIALAFTLVGLAIGGAGALLGAAIGASASWLLTTFELVRFGPEIAAIYFVDAVVFDVRAGEVAAVLGLAVVTSVLSSLVPALRATKIEPSEALRAE